VVNSKGLHRADVRIPWSQNGYALRDFPSARSDGDLWQTPDMCSSGKSRNGGRAFDPARRETFQQSQLKSVRRLGSDWEQRHGVGMHERTEQHKVLYLHRDVLSARV
jgi:hypothetical protein